MDGSKLQKAVCMVPGIGVLFSIYYFLTNKDLRKAAAKGLMLLPISAFLISSSTIISIPSPMLLLAGAYLYWSILALAAGWGLLASAVVVTFIVKASTGKISTPQVYVDTRTQAKPQPVITYESFQKRPEDAYNDFNETVTPEDEQ